MSILFIWVRTLYEKEQTHISWDTTVFMFRYPYRTKNKEQTNISWDRELFSWSGTLIEKKMPKDSCSRKSTSREKREWPRMLILLIWVRTLYEKEQTHISWDTILFLCSGTLIEQHKISEGFLSQKNHLPRKKNQWPRMLILLNMWVRTLYEKE